MPPRLKAVYAGTFDPLTLGHWWMIQEGARLFDHLIVAVGVNPDKKPLFTPDERVAMIEDTIRHGMALTSHVTVKQFTNKYLVEYTRSEDVGYILRGIRNPQDFHIEQIMRNVNRDMASDIETVFLMPPRDIAEVSSSMVKALIGPEGWRGVVRRYVPDPVFVRLVEKF